MELSILVINTSDVDMVAYASTGQAQHKQCATNVSFAKVDIELNYSESAA